MFVPQGLLLTPGGPLWGTLVEGRIPEGAGPTFL